MSNGLTHASNLGGLFGQSTEPVIPTQNSREVGLGPSGQFNAPKKDFSGGPGRQLLAGQRRRTGQQTMMLHDSVSASSTLCGPVGDVRFADSLRQISWLFLELRILRPPIRNQLEWPQPRRKWNLEMFLVDSPRRRKIRDHFRCSDPAAFDCFFARNPFVLKPNQNSVRKPIGLNRFLPKLLMNRSKQCSLKGQQ